MAKFRLVDRDTSYLLPPSVDEWLPDEHLARAEQVDAQQAEEQSLPEELERREQRLGKIREVKAIIEERAQARYETERDEYEAKLADRAEKERRTGTKTPGREPKPPEPGPRDKDQVNFTDPESRIMPTSSNGWQQAYNAQASVDMDSPLIVGGHLSQAPNDKQQLQPAMDTVDELPYPIGQPENIVATMDIIARLMPRRRPTAG